MPSSALWTPLSLSLSSTSRLSPRQNPVAEARRQDCYLWDRHQADLRLSSLLPCGSHWKQMVSKQPVMFTAAAIKDKSPTTHSLRSPTGSHRGLQTAAWGGSLALHAPIYTHTLSHLELTPTLSTIQIPLLPNAHALPCWHKDGQAHTPNVLRQPVRTCYIYCN